MGTAWKNAGVYPWENPSYVGGIENVKILMALRLYSLKHHVYSGVWVCVHACLCGCVGVRPLSLTFLSISKTY